MFVNGAALEPIPPVTPVAMGKSTRGVELESVDELDERQIAAWMIQVAAAPGVGGKRRYELHVAIAPRLLGSGEHPLYGPISLPWATSARLMPRPPPQLMSC